MTTKTKVKPMTFEKVLKVFKPFVAKKTAVREVLKMVHFDGEYLQATDSHILLRVHKDFISDLPSNEPFLWDYHNNTTCEKSLNYFNLSRMIPEYFECEATYKTKELLLIVTELKKVAEGKVKPIRLSIEGDKTTLTAYNATEQREIETRTTESSIKGKELNICLGSDNFKNVLSTVKVLSSEDNITLQLTGKNSPLRISQKGIFDILVSPIRLY